VWVDGERLPASAEELEWELPGPREDVPVLDEHEVTRVWTQEAITYAAVCEAEHWAGLARDLMVSGAPREQVGQAMAKVVYWAGVARRGGLGDTGYSFVRPPRLPRP
jgi:hypothetical protein